MARKTSVVRIALSTAFVFALALVPAAFAGKGGGSTGSANSGCSISPGQVVLDQVWTVSASGLPNSTVNMIITFPNGGQSTGPITAAIKAKLVGIQRGEIADEFGWVRRIG